MFINILFKNLQLNSPKDNMINCNPLQGCNNSSNGNERERNLQSSGMIVNQAHIYTGGKDKKQVA